jgi:hypothetical protein
MGELGSVDVLSKKLIYIFQLDNLKHDFFNRNSGYQLKPGHLNCYRATK